MKFANVFLRKMEYNIVFCKPCRNEDFEYIRDCYKKDDFKSFISNNASACDKYYIIRCEERNLGICSYCISELKGIKTAEPILYMERKKSINTLKTINSLIHVLFEVYEVDRIEIKVFGNNTQMKSIMSSSVFTYEGCLKYCNKDENGYKDLYFYLLLRREYDALLAK